MNDIKPVLSESMHSCQMRLKKYPQAPFRYSLWIKEEIAFMDTRMHGSRDYPEELAENFNEFITHTESWQSEISILKQNTTIADSEKWDKLQDIVYKYTTLLKSRMAFGEGYVSLIQNKENL